ncbi:unnamed protein product [Chrysodeixis includens]|uniref:Uncharacterized protein n=1 Tax=Chrysodeixis includens TaxID=689277 RepID=A0A9N8PXC5_CHRIL|nr:unnamed protein product [Chrysodeixis includens]
MNITKNTVELVVRAHTGLCLLIHHCTSARYCETHDFTVTARGGLWPAGVTARTSTDVSKVPRLPLQWRGRQQHGRRRRREVKPRTETVRREVGATSARESVRAGKPERWQVCCELQRARELYETTRVTRRRRLTGAPRRAGLTTTRAPAHTRAAPTRGRATPTRRRRRAPRTLTTPHPNIF